jgi:ribosomal protein L20A (L18A)
VKQDDKDLKEQGLNDFLSRANTAEDEEIKCFKRRRDKLNQDRVFKTMDREEFERAVKIAEADINKLSPDDLLEQLENLKKIGAPGLRDEAEQNRQREVWSERHYTALPFLALELQEKYPELSQEEATASVYRELGEVRFHEAESAAQALRKENPQLSHDEAIISVYRELGGPTFSKVDIMHTRDIGGGGNPKGFSGLGDSSINRSIGAQWTKAKLRALKAKAEKAKREGKNRMDIRLSVCPESDNP